MTNNINEEHIRVAAYYIWQNAGCPSGQDEYFWSMAVEQISKKCNKTSCCKKASSSTKKSSSAKKTSSKKSK